MREWSPQQKAVFGHVEHGQGNLVVRARAGTGKTSTIMEALKYIPSGKKVLLCAFNKKIADELTFRISNMTDIQADIEAKTLHSLGFAFVRQAWRGVRVDDRRGEDLARKAIGFNAYDSDVSVVKKLASLAKGACPRASQEDLVQLALDYEIEPSEGSRLSLEDIAAYAKQAMALALVKDGTLDFDDMIFVPVVNEWIQSWYDVVLIDECQDLNASQIELALKAHRN